MIPLAKPIAVVARLPAELACGFPGRSTPPHVTLLYFEPESERAARFALNQIDALAKGAAPIEVELLGGVSYFEPSGSSGGRRVAYVPARSEAAAKIREALLERLARIGVRAPQAYEFRPHATLAYLDPGASYDGEGPAGSWQVEELEVWRGEGRERIRLEPASWPADLAARRGGRSIFQI